MQNAINTFKVSMLIYKILSKENYKSTQIYSYVFTKLKFEQKLSKKKRKTINKTPLKHTKKSKRMVLSVQYLRKVDFIFFSYLCNI